MARPNQKKCKATSAASDHRVQQPGAAPKQRSGSPAKCVAVLAAGVAIGVFGLMGIQVLRSSGPATGTSTSQSEAKAAIPTSHYDLLAMTPNELGKVDVALVNLLCAKGLPGAENLDIPGALKQLDAWAAKVKFETERHLYRVTDPRYAEHYANSEARLRAEFIVQVLQEDCGVKYNPDRIYTPDFRNSKDSFLHGMIGSDNGGTCASMPVMYVAIGRRLGYPLKLVAAKQHLFCRWDDGNDRFNIEGATNGGVSYHPDEYYRTWPRPISDAEMQTGEFLRSLTPAEELANFLLQRGTCLYATGRHAGARAALAEAHALMPEASTMQGALWWTTHGENVPAARRPARHPSVMRDEELEAYLRSIMPPDPRTGQPQIPRPGGGPQPVPPGPRPPGVPPPGGPKRP